ncbi:uncharacterized protein LOC127750531 [Frankliniella occidentalis]|uniref:Uncharacterized protein LOC127750531 n=1 Tax=Frankliniella occidentalis TaxID=133901 RepID=A0A9C6XRH2_FRAOC|nr:uncharacterized protein LOC127750531 [Frankliniella occidentalis]
MKLTPGTTFNKETLEVDGVAQLEDNEVNPENNDGATNDENPETNRVTIEGDPEGNDDDPDDPCPPPPKKAKKTKTQPIKKRKKKSQKQDTFLFDKCLTFYNFRMNKY